MDNLTIFTEFLLMDVTRSQELQVLQGVLFLVIYLGALTGNLVTVTVIITDTFLHSPMYIFISNMALLDLGSISVVPRALVTSLTGGKMISLRECALQIFLFTKCVAVEFDFLVVMSYDCYGAICHPLHYGEEACVELWVAKRYRCRGLHRSGSSSLHQGRIGRSQSRSSSHSKHAKKSKHKRLSCSCSPSCSRSTHAAASPGACLTLPKYNSVFWLAVRKCSSLDEKIRHQETEEKLIEEETPWRVEELVVKGVEEELEKRKNEIEQEDLRRVEETKRIMEKHLLELQQQRQAELTAQKAREEEERAKREELGQILEENNRKTAEAQGKLAVEQLRIV
ncbi:Olfactory receptor 14J1 [Heterocephalus glaber]|uniref:Olfactory receptor 14J1 n=1 Tax=Heterocephalus glaber TaxID=10181 RepID=G5BRJ5_HETGA|nr:Olfactory receptor 14J1 [Heterocephalus glaber]